MRVRFDRGTLVLEPEHGIAGDRDPSQIPGAAWDDTHRAWRLPAERYRELRVQMADERFRIPDTPAEIGLDGAWQLPPPRWYQTTALSRWKTAGKRGVIALPTGSGKTLVALTAIAELGVPALIIVPTRVLLEQWASSLEKVWSQPIGRIGDGDYQVEPITVCTYSSAQIWASRIGDRFGLVIVDEAHHVGAWCPGEVLEMLTAPARMGLTATPPPPGGELGARIGPVVYSLSVADLTGDALAEYELVSVPIALAKLERERYRTQRSRFAHVYAKHARRERGQMDWRRFVNQATRTPAGREALDAWKDYRSLIAYSEGKRAALKQLLAKHRGERTLVFTADVATAYQIARELLVMPITHEIGRTERAQVIEKFRTGEITVLVSAQVLDEGFDVPDADVAIIVGGSSSARRQVQRIGRVLRPREGKRAVIYELAVLETTEVDYVRRRHGEMEEPDPAQPKLASAARESKAAGRDVRDRASTAHESSTSKASSREVGDREASSCSVEGAGTARGPISSREVGDREASSCNARDLASTARESKTSTRDGNHRSGGQTSSLRAASTRALDAPTSCAETTGEGARSSAPHPGSRARRPTRRLITVLTESSLFDVLGGVR
jgi:superfamily II DNA or RNA helicase